jgi:hypothetical protein
MGWLGLEAISTACAFNDLHRTGPRKNYRCVYRLLLVRQGGQSNLEEIHDIVELKMLIFIFEGSFALY